jgi:hypothetical protein
MGKTNTETLGDIYDMASDSIEMPFARNWVLSWTDRIPATSEQAKILRAFGVNVEDSDGGDEPYDAFVDHNAYFEENEVGKALARFNKLMNAKYTYAGSLALVLVDSEG